MDDSEAVWLVTFIAVVVLDVALGLLIGIVFSLYFVLRHSQKPQMSQLGQVPGTGAYKDTRSAANLNDVKGMKIFRFETSIYFANAEHFRDKLFDKTGLVPRKMKKKKRRAMHMTLMRRKAELEAAAKERQKELERERAKNPYALEVVVKSPVEDPVEVKERASRENKLILERFGKAWQPPIKVLIIDLSVVNYVDTVGVRVLSEIVNDYKEVGIKVFLAGCKPDVRQMLRKADFYKMVSYNSIYFTVHEAVVIGQEIVDDEIKKNMPNPIDVKLYKNMTTGEPRTEKEENEELEEEEDEQEEEREPDLTLDINLEGYESELDESDSECDDEDDSEQYDTSPEDMEETMVSLEAVQLLQDHDNEAPPTPNTHPSSRSGSAHKGGASTSRKGVTFEMLPMSDKSPSH